MLWQRYSTWCNSFCCDLISALGTRTSHGDAKLQRVHASLGDLPVLEGAYAADTEPADD